MALQQHLSRLGLDADAIAQQLPKDLALSYHDGVLSLYEQANARSQLCVDFVHGSLSHRSRQHLGAENLVKACQIKGHSQLKILDGTCGLGSDSFLLHQAGFQVTAVEKNPVIHALLVDGICRYEKAFNQPCFTLIKGDMIGQLMTCNHQVIYLDPMFPEKTKSAKNKKNMQLFQSIHHAATDDAMNLLEHALNASCQRVVIKRPTKSPILTQAKPTFQVLGKNCRFDAYQRG